MTNRAADPDSPLASEAPALELAAILLDSLGAMVGLGDVEGACRLAGRACARLRHTEPQLARRFDVFLHRQAKHLEW